MQFRDDIGYVYPMHIAGSGIVGLKLMVASTSRHIEKFSLGQRLDNGTFRRIMCAAIQ